MDFLELYVDGGARGNPGPAGGGFAAYMGGALAFEGCEFFGHKTNNQAEYMALIAALRQARKLFPKTAVLCRMDSQLVVEQLLGNYKVRSANVKPLYAEVRTLLAAFPSFTIEHIRREQNKRADALANEAMDSGA